MRTTLRNKTVSKSMALRKYNPFPQSKVASYKRPGSGFLLKTQQHYFQREGEGRIATALMSRKMLSKHVILSSFVQDCRLNNFII